MSELLTVTQEPDKIVVTEQDGVTLVTVIAPGPQGVPGSSILPDASATVKGALKLRNDLGGTAESPTVPGLALKASKTYVDAQDDIERSEREAADTALQVEIDEKYDLPASGVARTDLDASTRASLTKADTALQVAPVTSVAGKTGAVTVTKADVGLGSAENTSDLTKPVSTATQTALNTKADITALTSHTSNVSNPHATTKTQVGLGSVDNTADTSKPVSTAQAAAIALKADTTALTSHTSNTSNPHATTKAQVGLGNIDNTSDSNKPVSTATQSALDTKVQIGGDIGGTALVPLVKNTVRVVNVQDYGATGNGSTDDTSAFTAAIAAASGRAMYVPKGTYMVNSAALQLLSDTEYFGYGRSSVIKTTRTGVGRRGVFNIENKNNVNIHDLAFDIGGDGSAIASRGHPNLRMANNYFTGTTTDASEIGYICLNGLDATTDMNFSLFDGNTFENINSASVSRIVNLYPRNGYKVLNTTFTNNTWRNTRGVCILGDTFDILRGTVITNNKFFDILQGSSTIYSPPVATMLGLSRQNCVYDTLINDNYYSNSVISNAVGGFVFFYGAHNTSVIGNTAVSAWSTANPGQSNPAIAPGRIDAPTFDTIIQGNTIKGFESPCDPDSMINADISGNIVVKCGQGFNLGYRQQQNVKIHHNTHYNSSHRGYKSATAFYNANTMTGAELSDNLFVDDRPMIPTQAVTATLQSGGSLTQGVQYFYVMTSLDESGETLRSAEVSVTPTSTNKTARIAWRLHANATGYKIFRTTTAGSYGASSLVGVGKYDFFDDNGITLTAGSPPTTSTVAPNQMEKAITLTGNVNFSSVIVKNNRFMTRSFAIASLFTKELGGEVEPLYRESNVIDDTNGVRIDTGNMHTNGGIFSGAVSVPDDVYSGSWDGSVEVPTKNAVYDKIQSTIIAAGTTAQYRRGDNTWQTLNQDAVPDGTTNKAYTASDKTRLASTSGTNTGDQVLPTSLPPNGSAGGDLTGTYPNPTVPGLAAKASITYVDAQDATKVDKVTGKGLSTEDYSTADKTRLSTTTGTNTGDQTIPTTLPPSGAAGGDLTGSYPNPTLAAAGTAGTYGTASQVPVLTTDSKGRVSSVANTSVQITESQVTGLVADLLAKADDANVVHKTGTETVAGSKSFTDRLIAGTPAHATQGALHVGGQGIFDNGLSFQWDSGGNTYNPNMLLSGFGLEVQSFGGQALVLNRQGNNVTMFGATTGNLGLATTSPSSRLHVAGSFATATNTVTTATTLNATNSTLRSNLATALTHTLPTAVGITGRLYTIKSINTGVVTIATTSSQTIDGASTYVLATQYKYVTVQSNGATWDVVANN